MQSKAQLAVVKRADEPMMTFDETMQLGTVLASSGYYADAKDASQAVAKILTGRELGFGPMMSLSGVYIIQGKPSLSANLMASAIKRSGKYDYRIKEHTNEVCAIEFFQGGESLGVSRFSKEDAQIAGALDGQNKHSWKKYPRNMLFARAMSNGARFFTPDIFGGPVFDPEELGAGLDTQTGEYIPTARTERVLTDSKSAAGAGSTEKNVTPTSANDERAALNLEVGQYIDTLSAAGHPSFRNGDGQRRLRILEHVRGVALDREWDYKMLNSLGDLSIEHLGVYAGILEGEIQAIKEARADVEGGVDPTTDIGI